MVGVTVRLPLEVTTVISVPVAVTVPETDLRLPACKALPVALKVTGPVPVMLMESVPALLIFMAPAVVPSNWTPVLEVKVPVPETVSRPPGV